MLDDFSNENIETPRLSLVPISRDFAEDIFRELNDEVCRYTRLKPPAKIAETLGFIDQSIQGMQDGTNLQLVVLDRETGEFLGCIGLQGIGDRSPELGLWLKLDAQHKGYGREGIEALLRWAESNIVYEFLTYPVDRKNTRGRKIPESNRGKVMAEYEAEAMNGSELDFVEYHIYPHCRNSY